MNGQRFLKTLHKWDQRGPSPHSALILSDEKQGQQEASHQKNRRMELVNSLRVGGRNRRRAAALKKDCGRL